MGSDPSRRVVVVGAGLAGLAVAGALRRLDVDATVLERSDNPVSVGGIIGVSAKAAAALERIGLGDVVEQSCIPVQRLEYVDWKARHLTYMPISEVAARLGTRSFIALRADVHRALVQGIGPGVVRVGSTVAGFDEDDAGVDVRLEHGGAERAAILLGCDGRSSAVRAQLHGDRPLYAGYCAWRAVTPIDPVPLPPGVGRQVLGRGRTFGMFGLTDGRIYWWASALTAEGRTDSAEGRKHDVTQAFAGAPPLVQSALEATDESLILRNDVSDQPYLDRWGTRRVTLLGDAAHATTPNTGEGGSHALIDGVVVAEALAPVADRFDDAATVEAALRSYEEVRIPETADVVKRAREIGKFLHIDNPVMAKVRDLVFYKATPKRIWEKRAAVYFEANR